jgi:rRNA small subunit pseudouridine methyltransferase Nep1
MILADAELELVPKELQDHPSVIKNAKRRRKSPSKLLLDSSLHRSAFKDRDEALKHGRPDIVQFFLSLCLDSIPNAEGKLTTIVHTRNNELIKVSPDLRMPRSHNRFVGLMEELLDKGQVPGRKPLMKLTKNTTLEGALKKVKPETTICMAPDGELVETVSLFEDVKGPTACIIGGFPEGDYSSPAKQLSDRVVSISPHLLKVWTVASNILVSYNQSQKTYK